MRTRLIKLFRPKIQIQIQYDAMDCAPTCLKMLLNYYGIHRDIQSLRELMGVGRDGVSLYNLKKTSIELGFQAAGIKTDVKELKRHFSMPCILHWDSNHYVILYKIKKDVFYVADPAVGYVKYKQDAFVKLWQNHGLYGVVLLLEPHKLETATDKPGNEQSLFSLLHYFAKYKSLFFQLFLGLLVSSAIQILFPVLTQNIVDRGINQKDISFIFIVALGQLMLLAGRMSVEFIRGWILLHISVRVNLSLLSGFLVKLMNLPMKFFDSKNVGDIIQRINDHKRIEQFLTASTLSTLFSFLTFVVFSIYLLTYSIRIFGVFLIASILYVAWSVFFLKKRKELDYKKFGMASKNQNAILQIIEGISEIKLNNAEARQRSQWEHIQKDIFKLNIQALALGQNQQLGAFFINESKNIIILCVAAYSVIINEITLGTMMAIQYIVGQLNSPINQFISIMQIVQDAKISLERINEVQHFKDEVDTATDQSDLLNEGSISLFNVSFSYPGNVKPVLKNLTLEIPHGKTTAIVGTSGSGKTTLLKLLLKYYIPCEGEIKICNQPLSAVSATNWREKCGAVMQDGFIFSDTISHNVAPGAFDLNTEKLNQAIEIANLTEFVDSLPAGLETKIGLDGNGVSQGQRQRILIARSVYKDPAYIFFDEATNALDANNEKMVIGNLDLFFRKRTVVIVAHRLSTVIDADKIVVLDKGRIVEEGSHFQLLELRGKYYELIRNQLELSNS